MIRKFHHLIVKSNLGGAIVDLFVKECLHVFSVSTESMVMHKMGFRLFLCVFHVGTIDSVLTEKRHIINNGLKRNV